MPRAHRLLKAPPAARAIVASCHIARTKGVPADIWCHVLGFLSGFDFLYPSGGLLQMFSLPETYLDTADLRARLHHSELAPGDSDDSGDSVANSLHEDLRDEDDYYDADY